jgi:predicted class III extradiol MEMO1 family dioxygenase
MPLDELCRPVWVTPDQHDALIHSCETLLGDSRCDSQLCHQLMMHLMNAKNNEQSKSTTVVMVVRHLRLPPGSVPVLLSDQEIRILITYGRLPHGISEYLSKFLPLADNGWRNE